jgi:membrane-bound serine protease (ClpP class)
MRRGLIDLVAASRDSLLASLDRREIQRLDGRRETLRLARAAVEVIEPTFGDRVLTIVAQPEVACLLMLLGYLDFW